MDLQTVLTLAKNLSDERMQELKESFEGEPRKKTVDRWYTFTGMIVSVGLLEELNQLSHDRQEAACFLWRLETDPERKLRAEYAAWKEREDAELLRFAQQGRGTAVATFVAPPEEYLPSAMTITPLDETLAADAGNGVSRPANTGRTSGVFRRLLFGDPEANLPKAELPRRLASQPLTYEDYERLKRSFENRDTVVLGDTTPPSPPLFASVTPPARQIPTNEMKTPTSAELPNEPAAEKKSAPTVVKPREAATKKLPTNTAAGTTERKPSHEAQPEQWLEKYGPILVAIGIFLVAVMIIIAFLI